MAKSTQGEQKNHASFDFFILPVLKSREFYVILQVQYKQMQGIMTKAEITSEIAKTTGIDKAEVVIVSNSAWQLSRIALLMAKSFISEISVIA